MTRQCSTFGGERSATNKMKKKKPMVNHQRSRKLIEVTGILEPFIKQLTTES